MGTDVAIRERTTTQMTNEQLAYIMNTEFVPQGLRGNKPAILACVVTGRALGLDDMSSLRLIHVVNGRPTFSAELMTQIVRRHGHSIQGEVGSGSATVTGKRADNGDEMTSTWTLEMAQRAGLAGKQVWKAYPEAMLWARAVSQLCRMLFADCFAGGTYAPDELADGAEVAEFAEIEDSAGEPSGDQTVAPLDAAAPAAATPTGEPEPSPADVITAPQKKKLNVLIGQLRPAHITTEQLYAATGREVALGEDGVAHWAPLRDSLSKDEASALIERLEKFAVNVGLGAAA